MLSTDNLIIPDQTFYVDEEFPSSTVKNLKLVDGKLEAGPIDFQVPSRHPRSKLRDACKGWKNSF